VNAQNATISTLTAAMCSLQSLYNGQGTATKDAADELQKGFGSEYASEWSRVTAEKDAADELQKVAESCATDLPNFAESCEETASLYLEHDVLCATESCEATASIGYEKDRPCVTASCQETASGSLEIGVPIVTESCEETESCEKTASPFLVHDVLCATESCESTASIGYGKDMPCVTASCQKSASGSLEVDLPNVTESCEETADEALAFLQQRIAVVKPSRAFHSDDEVKEYCRDLLRTGAEQVQVASSNLKAYMLSDGADEDDIREVTLMAATCLKDLRLRVGDLENDLLCAVPRPSPTTVVESVSPPRAAATRTRLKAVTKRK